MADYLPTRDSELRTWLINFSGYAGGNAAALGLTPAEATALTGAVSNFTALLDEVTSTQALASSSKEDKNLARRDAKEMVRAMVRKMQANPSVTDNQRQAMQITVASPRTPVAPPVTRPLIAIDLSERLMHRLNIVDETTPTSRAKPEGVRACEIWYKVGGTVPVDASELNFAGAATRLPFELHFRGEDAGKTAYYWARWTNTKNDPGPWSAMISGTVAG